MGDGTLVTLSELARVLQSPALRHSYVFVSGDVNSEDLGVENYSEYHFADATGSPVTLLVSPEVIPRDNLEEYEFVKLLEKGHAPEFSLGRFHNPSSGLEAVTSVIQGKSVYFQLTDSPEMSSKEKTYKPKSDQNYPLVSAPLVESPTKPASS